MADVAISYSRPRREAVEYLAAVLEGYGYSVWWDKYLRAGVDFDRQIKEQFAQAKAVLLLWCSYSAREGSRWVAAEGAMASRRGTLIPLFIEQIEVDDLPLDFQRQHGIELYHWDGRTDAPELSPLLRELRDRTQKPARANKERLRQLDMLRESRKLTGLATFPTEMVDTFAPRPAPGTNAAASVPRADTSRRVIQRATISGTNNTIIQVGGNYRAKE